jgi:hypothetical protein
MQDPEKKQQLAVLLVYMFDDRRFRMIASGLWQANIDGTKVGVVVARRPRHRDRHLLNCDTFERMMKSLAVNGIDFAFVVTADEVKVKLTYVGCREAGELQEMLKDVPPLKSKYKDLGPFWLLKADVTPSFVAAAAEDIDDDEEDYM